jgi:uncharacterized protein YdhG (YjbR/CyaY superfamily)
MSVIDDHLGQFAPRQRKALLSTVSVIRRALPGAVEVISYGMPTFKAGDASGPAIIGIDGFTNHNSLFPYSGGIPQEFGAELAAYPQSKGSVHFDVAQPFPAPLLKRILKARIREINATYPKRNGEAREYYDNGRLKASGRVKDDEMIGAWKWYRRDGSLMRSGGFRHGAQYGEWATYDRNGNPVKVTVYR